jgi:hypothetical protein
VCLLLPPPLLLYTLPSACPPPDLVDVKQLPALLTRLTAAVPAVSQEVPPSPASLVQVPPPSLVQALFGGRLSSCVVCQTCSYCSVRRSPPGPQAPARTSSVS